MLSNPDFKRAFAVLAACLSFSVVDAQAADIQARTLKLAHAVPKDNPIGVGATRFAELVSQKSGNKIKVNIYDNAQLGGELALISSAQGGVLEMLVTATATAGSVVKEFGVFDLPFLFANERQAAAVLDGPIGTQLLDKLPEKALVGLCYWEQGFRNTTNSKRPIAKLEDLRGIKIRTVQNPVYIDTFNALGANATPLPFPEVYSALESKAVDAAELPHTAFNASKFNEVQKFLSETRHIFTPTIVAVSKKFWDQLSADERKVFHDSCVETRDYERQVQREGDAKARADLIRKGMVFNDIAPAERERMRAAVKPVIEKHSQRLGEDFVKKTFAEIEKVRN